ncbi:hypothetical protein FQN50_002598 [Emmonsiellopsis sp. PD_5]|nr:hypothetical protein FQN50_002598 [Emmonsiellopsis sp. PD_5]
MLLSRKLNNALFPRLARVCFSQRSLLFRGAGRCPGSRGSYLSAFQNCHQYSTSRNNDADDDDDVDYPTSEAMMTPARWDALFAGFFPLDISGEVLHLKTSLAEFHRLNDAFRENEARAPVVDMQYNPKFSRTSIYWKKSHVHQIIAGEIGSQLHTDLPCEGRFDAYMNLEICPTLPIPNLYLSYTDEKAGRHCGAIFVVEIGLSEPRKILEDCIRELLKKKRNVRAAVLIEIDETPKFKNPLREPENWEIGKVLIELDRNDRLYDKMMDREVPSDKHSALFEYGLRWFGRTRASAQVWTRDAESREAIPGEQVIFFGPDAQPNPKLRLKLSDFVPSDDEAFKKEYAFDCSQWARKLEAGRRVLARFRSEVAIRSLRRASQKK